jgi:hypothetical protein
MLCDTSVNCLLPKSLLVQFRNKSSQDKMAMSFVVRELITAYVNNQIKITVSSTVTVLDKKLK